MTIEVRPAQGSDVLEIKRIADANKSAIGFILRPIVQASIDAGELMVAGEHGIILGFLRFHKRRDGWYTVYEICVIKEARRRGIGRALLTHIPIPVRLKCPIDNESNDFYRKLGFQLTNKEKGRVRWLNIWSLHPHKASE